MLVGSRRLFGTNGIRGVVNEELTTQMVTQIGAAIGNYFRRGNLLVGHDSRTASPLLSHAIITGLNSVGCDVLDAGMEPTPAVQFWVKNHRIDGGIMITASHNPPKYNGVKVIWNDGIELSREQEIEIEEIYFNQNMRRASWNSLGKTREVKGIVREYVAAVREQVDFATISKRRYHVVVDAANSVASLAAPRLLKELGCKVTTINANLDGAFPGRLPEPNPENLRGFASTVKALGADLGVAYDSDADRSIFVDEKGNVISGDASFALIEKFFLEKHPGEKVVASVSSSRLIKDVADAQGGLVVWTKVGSVTVSRTMQRIGAKLGGEEYGGIFYGPHQPVRDGAMAVAMVLDILAKTRRRLSNLIGELPRYYVQSSRVPCPESLKQRVMEELIEQTKVLQVDTIDGVKVWFEDKSGILVRPSGTESVFRLYAEAKTAVRAERLVKEYSSRVRKIVKNYSC
jgi:phosphomannomutase / phosphoglucomutase